MGYGTNFHVISIAHLQGRAHLVLLFRVCAIARQRAGVPTVVAARRTDTVRITGWTLERSAPSGWSAATHDATAIQALIGINAARRFETTAAASMNYEPKGIDIR
jgi:hypothetical protein